MKKKDGVILGKMTDEYTKLLQYAYAAVSHLSLEEVKILAAKQYAELISTQRPELVTELIANIETRH
jgi:hypothetical protein